MSSSRVPVFSIALISALGLAYEVLLMRLFSITQWHHFAYMIISIALLGYGMSGAFLTVFQSWANRHFHSLFISNMVGFGISSIMCFLLAQTIPFNPLELFWDANQWWWLFLTYLILIIPFFCVANCVALVFSHRKEKIGVSYAADLIGAALGSLGVVALLYWLFPEQTLTIIASLAMFAALIAAIELRIKNQTIWLLAFVSLLPWLLPDKLTQLSSSEYKQLSQTLNIIDSKIVEQKSSPLGLLTVVESPTIPFRYAPGMSLLSKQLPPKQIGVFTDGGGMSVINRFDGRKESIAFLAQTTSALPYKLLNEPEVLILGAGGGTDVLQARYFDASHIEAVELNPQMVELVKEDYNDYAGGIYNHTDTITHIDEARSFTSRLHKKYDLIQVAMMDSFGAASAGLTSLNEDYLYTVDALRLYLNRLTPQGILSFTRWIKIPPRDTLKLLATAKAGLKSLGIKNPEHHIAVIRSWNTATTIIKTQALTEPDIDNIKQFSKELGFDLVYYPGIRENEVNQNNILSQALFYEGAKAILSDEQSRFLKNYKYDLNPSSDERPYFFHFQKLSALPEILRLPSNLGLPLIEWGTIILFLTLIQACIASVVLIILPLWLYRRKQMLAGNGKAGFVFSYFFIIGLAFMFVEIAFIQKFILFLGHPLYAFTIVICGFLLFAGVGSAFSKRVAMAKAIKTAISGIIVCSVLYIALLPGIFSLLISNDIILKALVSLILISPLAFFMGMPFPVAMSFIGKMVPEQIPWAWGVNGCASVISAVLATILAVHFGFNWVLFLALILYMGAGWLLVRQLKLHTTTNHS